MKPLVLWCWNVFYVTYAFWHMDNSSIHKKGGATPAMKIMADKGYKMR